MNVRVCSGDCAFLACQAIGFPGKAAALLDKRDDQASVAFMTKAGSSTGQHHPSQLPWLSRVVSSEGASSATSVARVQIVGANVGAGHHRPPESRLSVS